MTQSPIDDDFQDRIQRILNEKKKEDLRMRYGMQLEGDTGEMTLQEESEWLDYIIEFERQFENAAEISVRERIGNPAIRPLWDIAEDELESMLDHLLELLYANNIVVDFLNEVDDREAYRFISEELLTEKMDDIRIPDMYSHFIYEDFHPNDQEDVKQWAKEFLEAFFTQDDEMLSLTLGEEWEDLQGHPVSVDEFKEWVNEFHSKHIAIMAFSVDPQEAIVDGDDARVKMHTVWEGLKNDGVTINRETGISVIWLKRSSYSGWDVIRAEIAGLSRS